MLDKESSYREPPARCPKCSDTMVVQSTGDTRVDVCGTCAGVWVDWFDGDPVRAVRGVDPVRPAQTPDSSGSAMLCPRCGVPLQVEEFRESGPEVFRCGVCFGLLVPGESFRALAALNPSPTTGHGEESHGMWGALGALFRRVKHAVES